MRAPIRFFGGSGLICCVILLGASRGSSSQSQVQQGAPVTTATPTVSTMIGASVRLREGGTIGGVEDLVINDQGRIESIVVDVKQRHIAVPFRLAQVDFAQPEVVIDMTRERLLRLPNFQRTANVRTVSAMLGVPVHLRAGGTFARVEDLVIRDQRRLDFALLAFEQRRIAVPFSLTRVDFARRVVSIDVARERLLQAPSFTRDRFPDLSANSAFSQRVNTFFGVPTQTPPPATRPPTPPPKGEHREHP